ncbi:hypothetical protein [Pontibacterium sp.]
MDWGLLVVSFYVALAAGSVFPPVLWLTYYLLGRYTDSLPI